MKKTLPFILFIVTTACLGQNQNVDSLKRVVAKAEGSARIKGLIDLCWELRFANADSARTYGLEALRLAQEQNIRDYEVEALHNIGVTHEAQGNYSEALTFELKALKIRREVGDELKTANTLNNLGIIYDEQGNYQKALEYYFEARKIYERLNDQSKIAMSLVNIGIVLREQKQIDKAIRYYHQALTIYQRLDNKFALAACHANLGSVYLNASNYDSALHYSLLATHEFEEQKILQFLPNTLGNSGIAYDSLGKLDLALRYFLRAKKMNEEYDSKRELSTSLIQLADIYQKTNQLPLAESSTLQALDIANKIGAFEQQMYGHKMLAEIHSKKNDFRNAFLENKRYGVAKDSLFQQERAKQMEELQTKYETEKKEQEIQIQGLAIREQSLEIQRNQIFIFGLTFLVILLSIVGVLIRGRLKLKERQRSEQQKREYQEELTKAVIELQEKERSRFAQDLHDGFGQMITALKFQLENSVDDSDNAKELIGQMHDEIRNVSFALSPQVLTHDGLVQALLELSARLNKSNKINLQILATGLVERLPDTIEITLYRICQEWLNNVLKYSNATKIDLQLVNHADELIVTIEDDGDGFDPTLLDRSKGNGWKNIQSRSRILNGEVIIDSVLNRKGSTFILTIPSGKQSLREVA